ncbi:MULTISPECIES: FAD-dependent oxidoreductase [Nocardioides]|uniref:FAD-dependent oxidoreductase n=1 Tax=Nocardioides vastitatis TaxID=2568655 RepID=A0ABW0ZPX0_9ACTN|nr:FAD-dependent oxidoreductase [Nocardioides sp.]THJ07467.1 FAD-dependent oxidoreductase [Nocardioides sp.]
MERRSLWLATAELPHYSAFDGDTEVDVAVVGAGLVGLTTALLAQRDGARVLLLEGAQLGAGTTGKTTGKVTSQHGLVYADLLDRHGEETAGRYAEANQAGVEKVVALAEELDIDCELTRAPSYVYTRDPDQRDRIESEVDAAAKLGLPASMASQVDLPFDIEAAVRFEDQVHFHPGKYLAGLARALTDAGGVIHEDTRVTAVDELRDRSVNLTTATGSVHADQAVVATLLPMGLIGGYFAKTRPSRSYALAVRLAGKPPESMAISIDAPTRSTRPWQDDGLIVVGNGHEPGAVDDTESLYQDLEDWTRSTFDVASLEYRWSAQDYSTPDQIPYIGRSPASPMILVATGFKKWGLSNGTAAAMILADLLADRDNPWLPAFDASRVGDAQTVGRLVKDNLTVGKEFVGGRLNRDPIAAEDLAPGTGGVVDLDGKTVGGYRDRDDALHTVDLTCTHLGCPLHWNSAETSWDCRCHGSRFDVDGQILNGPSVKPLGTRTSMHEGANTTEESR